MQNDAVISGFSSLFALMSAKYDGCVDSCTKLLDNYLSAFFGISNRGTYLGLFCDLRELYVGESFDKQIVALNICSKMKGEVEESEQRLILLRLMEFCKNTSSTFDTDDELLAMIGKQFGVDAQTQRMFADFVNDRATDEVKLQRIDGYEGYFRTLWIEEEHRLLFSYIGNDKVLLNDIPVLPGVFHVWHKSCVLKNHKSSPLYYTTIMKAYEGSIANVVEFCGRDINFRYPSSDNGMHDLDFCLHSGELVAIMGGSGTGKTTLLSLLNGTLKPQQGMITINGHDANDPVAKALVGFVPQDDLLIEELTVYQNLYYTARLCFDGMNDSEIDRRVMHTLTNLGLDTIKDLRVGSPINKTISGGQRKRLNIALELIREPAVLMLDEPTSGLSSADTEHVVGLLKEQTYRGCLVIVNIHQPSSDVYKMFARLWLLDRGGYPIFDGNPIDAITYFKNAANYADADVSTCPYCGNVKPETVLNIIDEKALDTSGRISNNRRVTPQQWHEMYLEHKKIDNKEAKVYDIPPSALKKPGVISQFMIQLERYWKTKTANRQYMLITLLEAPLLALICSWLTRYAPESGYTVAANKNFVSFLFMAVIVSTFIGMSGSAEEIIRDRALLKREKFLHLSYGSYVSSKVVLLAAVSLLQTLVFIAVSQWVMGFHDLFFEWWLLLFAAAFVASLTGLLLSQCLNSVVAIYITIPLLLIPQILLCGVVVDFNDLNGKSITGNVPLIGNIIPSRWAYEALAVTTFTDNAHETALFDLHRRQYQNQYYRMSYLYEMESQLEKMRDEIDKGQSVSSQHMKVIATELPRLALRAGLEPYRGDSSYNSLKTYFKKADKVFVKRGNEATLEADRIVCNEMQRMGRDAYHEFVASHTNRKLESMLVNSAAESDRQIVDGYIVPMVGQVYLEPVTRCGGAPFYSAVKMIGNTRVNTMWFNLMVMAFMAVLIAMMIYTDCPGRFLRKS